MRAKNSFTQQEIDEMLKLHDDGLLNREIADKFETSKTMIARIFQELQIPSRHPWMTPERELQIKEYFETCFNKEKTQRVMHCGSSTLNSIIDKYQIIIPKNFNANKKYDVDDDYFAAIDTENKAYVLGILFADGSVSSCNSGFAITLQERDQDIIHKLNHEFAGDRKLTYLEYNKKNSNWQNQYQLAISNRKMHDDLIKHGCVPNKSLILKFPDIPKEYVRHFVRGYFDGDGSISRNEDRCNLISTLDFCTTLSNIVKNELSINTSIMYCHKQYDKPTRTFQIAGKNQVKKFLDWLYQDAELYLDRKYNLYREKYCSEL